MDNFMSNQQLKIAMHYLEMGRYETAENMFAELIAADPQNSCYLYYYARSIMLQNKETDKVEDIYKSLLVDVHYSFAANIELAEFYIAKIMQEYRKEIIRTLSSSRIPFVEQIAAVKNTRAMLEKKVLPLITEAARLKPDNCAVYAAYSRYYSAGRHFRKSKDFLAKAKEIDYQNPRVIQAESSLITRNGSKSNDTLTVSNILDSNISEYGKLIQISVSYHKAKKYKKAFEYAKQAYLISPADKTAITLLKQSEYLCKPIHLFFTFIYKKNLYICSLGVLLVILIVYLTTKFIPLILPLIVLLIYLIGFRVYFSNLAKKLNKIKEENSQ